MITMTTMTLTTAAPRPKRAWLVFAPLVLLVSAAIVTNFGGGIAGDAHAANTVTVTSSLASDVHITSTCGTAGTDGTLAFGAVNAATFYESNGSPAPCSIIYGSTQATTNLQLSSGSASLGWAGFGAKAAGCTVPAAGTIGIRADSSSTGATEQIPYNCPDGQAAPIPTVAATFCQTAAGADSTCDIAIAFNTGAVGAGAKTGTLTTTLA
jgi:hypothetical protein